VDSSESLRFCCLYPALTMTRVLRREVANIGGYIYLTLDTDGTKKYLRWESLPTEAASSYVATHPNAADEDRGARFMPVSRLKGRRGPARASSSQKSRRKRTTTKRLQPSRVQRERLCTRWSRPRPLHLRLERPLRVPRQWALKLRRWPPPMSSNLLPRSRCACPSKF
jgi:hypothetical protein